jgi:hypothetical protein
MPLLISSDIGICANIHLVRLLGRRWTCGALVEVLEPPRVQLVQASAVRRPLVSQQIGRADEHQWLVQMVVALLLGVRPLGHPLGLGLPDLALTVAAPLHGNHNLGLKLHMVVLATRQVTVELLIVLELAQRRLHGNPVPVHHTAKITAEVALTPSQLARALQHMAPRLRLALELQLGEERQQARQLLDRHMMRPHPVELMTISQLHTAVLLLQQLRLRHRGMETKQQRQQRPKGQTESRCGTTGLMHPRLDMMLPRQPQVRRPLLRMEVVMMHQHQRRGLGMETARDILKVTRSEIGWFLQNCCLCSNAPSFAVRPNSGRRKVLPEMLLSYRIFSVTFRGSALNKARKAISVNEVLGKYHSATLILGHRV